MTDKEKRKLKAGVISKFNKFNILDHTTSIGGLRDDILKYINSFQEESTSVWHNVQYPYDETKPVLIIAIDYTLHLWKGKFDTDKMCNTFRLFTATDWNSKPSSIVSKWAYIDDLLKF